MKYHGKQIKQAQKTGMSEMTLTFEDNSVEKMTVSQYRQIRDSQKHQPKNYSGGTQMQHSEKQIHMLDQLNANGVDAFPWPDDAEFELAVGSADTLSEWLVAAMDYLGEDQVQEIIFHS